MRALEHTPSTPRHAHYSQLGTWIRQTGAPHALPAGAVLFGQGGPALDVCYVEEGWITLLRSEANGQDVIVGLRHAGALLGAGAAMSGAPHPMTARARTAVRLHTIPRAALAWSVAHDRDLRDALLRELGQETIAHVVRCGALGCLGAREHLERLLHEFATSSLVRPARIPLGASELAGLLAVDVSHAWRLLRALKRDGLIDTSRGWIVVPDPSRLVQPRPLAS